VPEEEKKSWRRDELFKVAHPPASPERVKWERDRLCWNFSRRLERITGKVIIEQFIRPLSHTATMSTGSNGARRMASLIRMYHY
jgi:hypothetical protein